MTRPISAPRAIPPAEARYFQLMAIGGQEEEPDAPAGPRSTAATAPLEPLIGARHFQLMDIGSLDDEPEPVRIGLVA